MKFFLAALALLGFVFSTSLGFAESNISSKKSTEKKSASKSKEMDSEAEKQKIEEERRAELNNSEWTVTVIDKGGDYAKDGQKDRLIFKSGNVSFASFESKGYAPAGYSLVVNPSAAGGTWETFVGGNKESRLSIRGDWHQNIMNGTIVEQLDEKTSKTYYFTSQEKIAIAPEEAKTSEAPSNALSALVSKENSGTSDSQEKRY